MRKFRINYILSLVLIFVLSAPLSYGGSRSDKRKAKQATKELNRLFKSVDAVGMATAVIKDGKIVYDNYFGVADLESNKPIDRDHVFRIASISKSFTTTALMTLVEQGKLSLDDDVSDIIGFRVRHPKYPETVITVRMLLNHTSSLNDSQKYGSLDIINPEKNSDWAKSYSDWEPGTKFRYSNLGFNTVGSIVEKVSGERFDRYVKKVVLDPMGLYASFNVSDLERSRFAKIYSYKDGNWNERKAAYYTRRKTIESKDYVMGYSTPVFSPTGGMKIGARDLAKYMAMHINYGTDPATGKQIISRESQEQMRKPNPLVPEDKSFGGSTYGLGLRSVKSLIPGKIMVGHTGSAYGLRSVMYFDPDTGVGVVMMTNGYRVMPSGYGFSVLQGEVFRTLYRIYND